MSKKKSTKKITPTEEYETFGEPVIIPEKVQASAAVIEEKAIEPEVIHYAVRRGDTLESIAEKFDTTVKKIIKDSCIDGTDGVSAGQRLVIKK